MPYTSTVFVTISILLFSLASYFIFTKYNVTSSFTTQEKPPASNEDLKRGPATISRQDEVPALPTYPATSPATSLLGVQGAAKTVQQKICRNIVLDVPKPDQSITQEEWRTAYSIWHSRNQWSNPPYQRAGEYMKHLRKAYTYCSPSYCTYQGSMSKQITNVGQIKNRQFMEKTILPAIHRASIIKGSCPGTSLNQYEETDYTTVKDNYVTVNEVEPTSVFSAKNTANSLRLFFTGVGMYTFFYEYFFLPPLVHFVTIELDPELFFYGSTQNHTVGSYFDIQKYREPKSVDVLVDNGLGSFTMAGAPFEVYLQTIIDNANYLLSNEGIWIIGYNADPGYADLEKGKQVSDIVSLLNHPNFVKTFKAKIGWMGIATKNVMHDEWGHVYEIYERVS